MSNKLYDVLAYIQRIGLPAIGTLYFALAQIWNLPYAEQVTGTIAAVTVFLGTILQISSTKYNKGIEVDG